MKLPYEPSRAGHRQPNRVWLTVRRVVYGVVGAWGWLLVVGSVLGDSDHGWIGAGLGGSVGLICWGRLWRLARGNDQPGRPA